MIVRRAAALLCLAAAPLLAAAIAAYQGRVEVVGPVDVDSIRELTPPFTINAMNFTAAEKPLTLRLLISTRADFTGPAVLDTTVAGDTVTIRPSRALPEKQALWWRATATTALGENVNSPLYGSRAVAGWVRLVSPNSPNGTLLQTRRPRFTWTALPVTEPPGPFTYDLNVISVGTQRTVVALRSWPDTTFLPTSDLESNTSYRWEVVARLATGETSIAHSASTFVVTDQSSPLTTLLYQNFPNPFPTATTSTTCIWFDLHQVAAVRLEIFDLRGHPVRRILRGSDMLIPGRYGRGNSSDPSACDPAFAWDGTADDGRAVPPGVYLVRLQAPGVETYRRILFRGR